MVFFRALLGLVLLEGGCLGTHWGVLESDLGAVRTENTGNKQRLEISGFEKPECVDNLAPPLSQKEPVTRSRRHTDIEDAGPATAIGAAEQTHIDAQARRFSFFFLFSYTLGYINRPGQQHERHI